MRVLEVRNAELLESITEQAAKHGITNAVVTLIGAVDNFTVSNMPAGDASGHIVTSYPLPAEMTATGEIVDGKIHIHAVMSIQGDRGVSGHLHQAQIDTWFARAYVEPATHDVKPAMWPTT